jgi:hypothetical protein
MLGLFLVYMYLYMKRGIKSSAVIYRAGTSQLRFLERISNLVIPARALLFAYIPTPIVPELCF